MIFTEKNCVLCHAAELSSLGSRALIVTGKKSSRLNGSLDDVCNALESHGVKLDVFDDIEENPSVETVMRARDFGLSCGSDFVIGIGGGSPLDAAKAIALMIRHGTEDESYLYKKGADSSALPVAAVPTTCGTGSEVTGVSVLTLHQERTKASMPHKIFPVLALVDAKYLLSAPQHIIRNTAVDALCHLFESVVNSRSTPKSESFAARGLECWRRARPSVVGGGVESEEQGFLLMQTSTLAGHAIAEAGTALPHGLSYPLTYRHGIPHGKACGRFLAGYLSLAQKSERDFLLKGAGLASLDELKELYQLVCDPSEIEGDWLLEAADVLFENKAKLASAPFPVTRESLEKIVLF